VPAGTWSNSVTKVGWVLGVGAERAITDGWSVKVEYLHVDLGRVNTTFGIPSQRSAFCGGFGTAAGYIPTLAGSGSISTRITDEIVRVGLNYKFGGPVVAKY
jgi:outer membrane immunogenic protein